MPQPIRLIIEGENATAGMFKSVFGELNRLNKETAVSAKSISRLFTGSILGREVKRLIGSALQAEGAEKLRAEFESIKKSIDEITLSLLEGMRPAISSVASIAKELANNLKGGLGTGAQGILANAQAATKAASTTSDVLGVKQSALAGLTWDRAKVADPWSSWKSALTGTDARQNQLEILDGKINSLKIEIGTLEGQIKSEALTNATNGAAGAGLMRLFGQRPDAMGILRGFGANARGPLAAMFGGLAGGERRLFGILGNARANLGFAGDADQLREGLRTDEERTADELRQLRQMERLGLVSPDTGKRQRAKLAESLRGDVRGFGAAGELMGEESRFLTQQRGQTDPQIRALEKANSLNERQAKALEEARKSLDRIEKKLDVPVNGKI